MQRSALIDHSSSGFAHEARARSRPPVRPGLRRRPRPLGEGRGGDRGRALSTAPCRKASSWRGALACTRCVSALEHIVAAAAARHRSLTSSRRSRPTGSSLLAARACMTSHGRDRLPRTRPSVSLAEEWPPLLRSPEP